MLVEELRTRLVYPAPLVLLIGCSRNCCCKYEAVLLFDKLVEDPPDDLYRLLERLAGRSRRSCNSKPEDVNELFDTVGPMLLNGRALALYLRTRQ